MHTTFSSCRAQPRRAIIVRDQTPVASLCMMHITIDASAVTALRRLVMRVCGDAMEFMRIAVGHDTSKIDVCVCVSAGMTSLVMRAVLRDLPNAVFAGSLPCHEGVGMIVTIADECTGYGKAIAANLAVLRASWPQGDRD